MSIRDKYLTEASKDVYFRGRDATELEAAINNLGQDDASGELYKISKFLKREMTLIIPSGEVTNLIEALQNGIERMKTKSVTHRTLFGGTSAIKAGEAALKKLKKAR